MQERLNQIIERKGLTATRFAAMIGVNASTISHILAGRNKPGFDIISNIAKAFPDLNLTWLITGQGNMENIPVQEKKKFTIPEPTLFDANPMEKKQEPVAPDLEVKREEEKEIKPSIIPSIDPGKRLKRIVLFFEDGSFEDYVKE